MNKTILWVVIAALVIGGAVGYFIAPRNTGLGLNITAYNCLNNAALCQAFQSVVQDLQTVRAPLAGFNQTSTTALGVTLGPIGSTTSTASTSITVNGAVVGDGLVFGISTSTSNVTYSAVVTAANTVAFTEQNVNPTAQAVATTTAYITLLPRASFSAAGALVTTTSTNF